MIPESIPPVPRLTTAPTGPLLTIESHFLERQAHIEAWFRRQWRETPPPFYASVDLRNAGFKLAPVDTNLFPAGFNNLNPAFLPLCIQAVQTAIEAKCPVAAKVLLIPESHTRNLFYLESLATLVEILTKAGYQVRLGSLIADLQQPNEITLPSGRKLLLEPLIRSGNQVGVQDFFPCLVLLNNDLAGGRPEILENLDRPITPPLSLGWSTRYKSHHFHHYHEVSEEFAHMVDIDPWLIDPLFAYCEHVDFMKGEGEACLAKNVDQLIALIQAKYDEYGISQKPFVVIKPDAGTYGMGIMTAHTGEDVRELNRKQRTRMAASKGGQAVTRVLLQEGVYTYETWGDALAVAEPVVYMIDRFVVGGFYRIHTERGPNENLNAPGMKFEPLAFVDSCNAPDIGGDPDDRPNRFYVYGVIARLALVAAAREWAEIKRKESA